MSSRTAATLEGAQFGKKMFLLCQLVNNALGLQAWQVAAKTIIFGVKYYVDKDSFATSEITLDGERWIGLPIWDFGLV